MRFEKQIIDPDYGRDLSLLEGSKVNELVHSAGVVVRLGPVKLIYCSGKTATDDQAARKQDRERIVGLGDIREQTRQVLRNLGEVLAGVGATLDDVVRVRVFVVGPMTRAMFQQIHEARAEFFKREHYPASTLVVVSDLARPGALIEIDADAVVWQGEP